MSSEYFHVSNSKQVFSADAKGELVIYTPKVNEPTDIILLREILATLKDIQRSLQTEKRLSVSTVALDGKELSRRICRALESEGLAG